MVLLRLFFPYDIVMSTLFHFTAFSQIWDPREKNVVQRIPVHTSDGGGNGPGGKPDFDTSMGPPRGSYAAAVACLACMSSIDGGGGVGGGGLGYVVSGGSESAVKVYH